MDANKTKVLVFENFNINDLKEEDKASLGSAIVEYLSEINGDTDKNKILPINQYGDFVVEAEFDESVIPNQHYKGIILKIKTHYGK